MKPEEMLVYRSIILEQIALQELQVRAGGPNEDPIGISRRIKQQRNLLSHLWRQADSLKKRNP